MKYKNFVKIALECSLLPPGLVAASLCAADTASAHLSPPIYTVSEMDSTSKESAGKSTKRALRTVQQS